MRKLINYIRQCFCKHDWLVEESWFDYSGEFRSQTGMKVYMRCKNVVGIENTGNNEY